MKVSYVSCVLSVCMKRMYVTMCEGGMCLCWGHLCVCCLYVGRVYVGVALFVYGTRVSISVKLESLT